MNFHGNWLLLDSGDGEGGWGWRLVAQITLCQLTWSINSSSCGTASHETSGHSSHRTPHHSSASHHAPEHPTHVRHAPPAAVHSHHIVSVVMLDTKTNNYFVKDTINQNLLTKINYFNEFILKNNYFKRYKLIHHRGRFKVLQYTRTHSLFGKTLPHTNSIPYLLNSQL